MRPGVWRGNPLVDALVLSAAFFGVVSGFLSPTAHRGYGNVPARALCLDYDKELLQFLSAYNFTQHTRSPLPELRVRAYITEDPGWHAEVAILAPATY